MVPAAQAGHDHGEAERGPPGDRCAEKFYHVTVITQNVDNLHRRAGSSVVHELHGKIERNYCTRCGKFYADPELNLAAVAVPRCPR